MSAIATPDILEVTFTEEAHEDICEAPYGCSRTAIWDLINECGCTLSLCQTHRDHAELIGKEYASSAHEYACLICAFPNPTWRFEPHRRRS